MRFSPPLIEATFLSRPNRFVARVRVGGREVLAHVHDPGRLTELLKPGARLLLQRAQGARKTAYDVVLVQSGRLWTAIYSTLANRLVHDALRAGTLPELGRYEGFQSEVTHGDSRFDFRLEARKPLWVEVKSASLVAGRTALFPDAPTIRGRRHLDHLAHLARAGQRAAVLFVVVRSGVDRVKPNDDTDPAFGTALRRAAACGVGLLARSCRVGPSGIALGKQIRVAVP